MQKCRGNADVTHTHTCTHSHTNTPQAPDHMPRTLNKAVSAELPRLVSGMAIYVPAREAHNPVTAAARPGVMGNIPRPSAAATSAAAPPARSAMSSRAWKPQFLILRSSCHHTPSSYTTHDRPSCGARRHTAARLPVTAANHPSTWPLWSPTQTTQRTLRSGKTYASNSQPTLDSRDVQ